ncbi:MAG: hypothetical protein AAF433_05610 [Bacteroidota bacterium]
MASLEVPDRVFITPNSLRKRYGDFDPNVFTRWQRQGKVEKIRNGLYLHGGYRLHGSLDRFCIAKQLYQPSYVSLISALRHYNIIPETVYSVTSIATRKTKSFQFRSTRYHYHQLKPELFFGYYEEKWRGQTYRIASREKALLDLAYLEPNFSDAGWLEEMRFDEDELKDGLDWDKMILYNQLFESPTVTSRIALLLNVYDL